MFLEIIGLDGLNERKQQSTKQLNFRKRGVLEQLNPKVTTHMH